MTFGTHLVHTYIHRRKECNMAERFILFNAFVLHRTERVAGWADGGLLLHLLTATVSSERSEGRTPCSSIHRAV